MPNMPLDILIEVRLVPLEVFLDHRLFLIIASLHALDIQLHAPARPVKHRAHVKSFPRFLDESKCCALLEGGAEAGRGSP